MGSVGHGRRRPWRGGRSQGNPGRPPAGRLHPPDARAPGPARPALPVPRVARARVSSPIRPTPTGWWSTSMPLTSSPPTAARRPCWRHPRRRWPRSSIATTPTAALWSWSPPSWPPPGRATGWSTGARRPEWVALEDKARDRLLLDAAGVAHPDFLLAPPERDVLTGAAARLDRGGGTVWAGDAREGVNGAGEYVRWIREAHVDDTQRRSPSSGPAATECASRPSSRGCPAASTAGDRRRGGRVPTGRAGHAAAIRRSPVPLRGCRHLLGPGASRRGGHAGGGSTSGQRVA